MGVEASPPIGGEPIKRYVQNEVEDSELAIKNLVDGVYDEWPNEAGVSLSLTFPSPPVSTQ